MLSSPPPDGDTAHVMSRPNRVLAVVVGAVVIFAVIAAVVAANRRVPDLDSSTPDGAVQTYLRAMLEGDTDTAVDLLSTSTGCDDTDVAAAFVTDSARIVLVESSVEDDTASVVVEITEFSGDGPFGGSEFSHEEQFSLENEAGRWLIVGEPWPLYFCDRG